MSYSIAILSPKAPEKRRQFWRDAFGGMRIPIMSADPTDTIFADGTRAPAYFVNFSAVSEDGKARFIEYARGKKNGITVLQGAGAVGYPVRVEDITVFTTPLEDLFWDMLKERPMP